MGGVKALALYMADPVQPMAFLALSRVSPEHHLAVHPKLLKASSRHPKVLKAGTQDKLVLTHAQQHYFLEASQGPVRREWEEWKEWRKRALCSQWNIIRPPKGRKCGHMLQHGWTLLTLCLCNKLNKEDNAVLRGPDNRVIDTGLRLAARTVSSC